MDSRTQSDGQSPVLTLKTEKNTRAVSPFAVARWRRVALGPFPATCTSCAGTPPIVVCRNFFSCRHFQTEVKNFNFNEIDRFPSRIAVASQTMPRRSTRTGEASRTLAVVMVEEERVRDAGVWWRQTRDTRGTHPLTKRDICISRTSA